MEQCRIHAARDHENVLVPLEFQLLLQRNRGYQRARCLVVEMAQVGGDGLLQQADTVVLRVAVEIGVEIRAHRNVQLARGRQGGPAQRAFGGDVHDVGPVQLPQARQQALGGQAGFQFGVTGYGHAGHERFRIAVLICRHVLLELARTDHVDAVLALAQTLHHAADGDGDAVHFGQVGFGDQRDIQRRRPVQVMVWCIHVAHPAARA